MDKHIGSLHRLLNHFEDHDEPTSKQKSNFSGAISLFPNGGCRSHDSASTMSKRKSAYKILRKVKDEIGFSMFLLCAFHFSRTALVEMKEPDKFCDELRNVTITEKFQAVATNYEQIHGDTLKDTASAAATGDHNSVVHTKRKFDGTELGGGEPTRQVRRITSEEGESSDKETNGHTSDPLLSDAPLGGKVYKLGVLQAFRLLAVNKESDLQVVLTMPDSAQWPFVTFRCHPTEAMRLLTELEQVM